MPTDTKLHQRAPMRTLGEVADRMDLGRLFKDPERFLSRQIKAGRIRAYKVGRYWLMTDADIEAAIESFATTQAPQPEPAAPAAPMPVGMPSAASLRRRRVA
jgi:hypothetical protein